MKTLTRQTAQGLMMTENSQISQIPVTVLTGYLGSGKTTLLNRILSDDHGKRYAVIVNEFGEIGIDNDLIVESDEEIYEMNNGCVCCTVRGDLIRVVEGLMKRKNGFDAILVETTGLADPAPVAQTFFMDDDVRRKARLDAVVAVVDALNLEKRLSDSPEAEDQVAFADVILLNKTDLVSDEQRLAVYQTIRSINAQATIHETQRCAIELDRILDRGAFDLDRILTLDPHFLESDDGHHHACGPGCDHPDHHHDRSHAHGRHDASVVSVSLEAGDLDPQRFFAWISEVTQTDGPDILRLKGILSFSDDPDRYVLQGVHMIVEGDHQRAWAEDEPRRSRLVFIGRNLKGDALKAGFEACQAEGA